MTEANTIQQTVTFAISPQRISKIFYSIAVTLVAAHLGTRFLVYKGLDKMDVINRLSFYFNLDNEQNVPTFFAFSILFISALLLFLIASLPEQGSDKKYWHILGFIFLFLSLDESIELHERLITPFRKVFRQDLSGFVYWAWVVPYSVFLLVIGLFFLKFILRLPRQTKNNMIVSGGLFISGALIIESLEGHFYRISAPGLFIESTITLQETLEMFGIIKFIVTLLEFILLKNPKITLRDSYKMRSMNIKN